MLLPAAAPILPMETAQEGKINRGLLRSTGACFSDAGPFGHMSVCDGAFAPTQQFANAHMLPHTVGKCAYAPAQQFENAPLLPHNNHYVVLPVQRLHHNSDHIDAGSNANYSCSN